MKVIANPSTEDSSFDAEKLVMVIGTANPTDTVENFLHECSEAILLSRGNLYSVYPDGNHKLRFVMDHAEFENYIKDLALAIEGVIKK